jgi:dTDP-glucose pyrophosphorylase
MKNIHVVIPMAGTGSRFADYGFKTPKFLLPLDMTGKKMIQAAVETLNAPVGTEYTFVVSGSVKSDDLVQSLKKFSPNWVTLSKMTEGPAHTAMIGIANEVEHDTPILISNSDQILENWDCVGFLQKCENYDGGVLTYKLPYSPVIGSHDKHSFVALDGNGNCKEFREKTVLNGPPLVGVHYFRNKIVFMNAYDRMVANDERAPNGEYYLSLMYNSLLQQGKTVIQVPLNDNERFIPTGEPHDYFSYINQELGPARYFSNDDTIFNLHNLVVKQVNNPVKTPNTCYLSLFKDVISTIPLPGNQFSICSPDIPNIDLTSKISDMFRGWCIGDFTPAFLRTKNFEVGIFNHKAGEHWDFHIHDHSDECNYIVSGRMTINDVEYVTGDRFVMRKGTLACPKFIEHCIVLCIKLPSIPGDKRKL